MKNILMIVIDDLIDFDKYRDIFGVEMQTPNYDRLLEMGVHFSEAQVSMSRCSPSRAGFLTGKSTFTTNVHANSGPDASMVAEEHDLLPRFLRDAGWFTVNAGKVIHESPLKNGAFRDLYAQQFDLVAPRTHGQKTLTADSPLKDYVDHRTASYIESFLAEERGDDPFFLAAGVYQPHRPNKTPAEFHRMFTPDMVSLDAFVPNDLSDVPNFVTDHIFGSGYLDPFRDASSFKAAAARHLSSIAFSDAQVGRILDAMDAADLWKDTTVVFFSDNGLHLGDKSRFAQKVSLYDTTMNTPLVIVDPDIGAAGTTVTRPVDLLDVWPTIADLVGLDVPRDLEGHSLAPLMRDPDAETAHGDVVAGLYGSVTLRTARWRYNVYNDGATELFDVGADPRNLTNLSGRPAYAGIEADLRVRLDAALAERGVEIVEAGETLRAGRGDDRLILHPGSMGYGGKGDDTFFVVDGVELKEREGEGRDTVILVSDQRYRLPDNVEIMELVRFVKAAGLGNPLDNILYSGYGPHLLHGGRGRDRLDGDYGDDTLIGGRGGDTLFGDRDEDLLKGEGGPDVLFGGRNDDRLFGGPGPDEMHGDADDDRMSGGAGRDTMHGGTGDDLVDGGDRNDRLRGGTGDDTIIGGNGNDRIFGEDGRDVGEGGIGGDELSGGALGDRLAGGDGDDLVKGDEGWDTLFGGSGADVLGGGPERDRLYGGPGDDRLHGGRGMDTLDGGGGRDTLIGGAAEDLFRLAAGPGAAVVRDFTHGEDRFLLAPDLAIGDLVVSMRPDGAGTVIDVAATADRLAFLEDVAPGRIDAGDFLLS